MLQPARHSRTPSNAWAPAIAEAMPLGITRAVRGALAMATALVFCLAEAVSAAPAWPACEGPFIRGDATADLALDVSDPIAILQHLFVGGQDLRCLDAADVDDSDTLEITDALRVLLYLFQGGPAPEAPYPDPGTDEPCNGGDDDGDGIVDEGCLVPSKRASRYMDGEVFVVSDADWRLVLPWVPVAVWTGRESWCERGHGTAEGVCAYPLLVYHQEGPAVDADSLVDLLEQLLPPRITLIGETPRVLTDLLVAISGPGASPEAGDGSGAAADVRTVAADSYPELWASHDLVVHVADDYEAALLATTYAALHNAPLVIEGHEPPGFDESGADGEDLVCVGDVKAANCARRLSIEEVQLEIVAATGSERIVLVSPGDLEAWVGERFVPQKTVSPLWRLYSKTSLAAPILASAKHQLIIETEAMGWEDVDADLEENIGRLALEPRYLTVVASPAAIPMSFLWTDPGIPADEAHHSADAWHYAQIDGDPLLDVAIGRIFGISLTDVTSSIARSLFLDRVQKNPDHVYVTRGQPAITAAAEVYALGEVLRSIGCSATVTPAGSQRDDWERQSLIVYHDHGAPDWAGIHSSQIPPLDSPLVVTSACLTCAFEEASDGDGEWDYPLGSLFCARALRSGAVGYIGATDTAGWIHLTGLLSEIFARKATIGEAFVAAKNQAIVYGRMFGGYVGNQMPHYVLLGDPTLRPAIGQTLASPRLEPVHASAGTRTYRLVVPAARIPIPDEIRDLCENPGLVRPLCFTTAVNWGLEQGSHFVCGFPVPEGFSPVAAPRNWRLLDLPSADDRRLWIGYAHPQAESLFESAAPPPLQEFDFPVTLYEKAPDVVVEDVGIFERELFFSVANRGCDLLDAPVTIIIFLLGTTCSAYPCTDLTFYVSPYYDPRFQVDVDLRLEPSEAREFRIPIPAEVQTASGLVRYDDYPWFLVQFAPRTPDDLVQEDYDDALHVFVPSGS